jgi:hypothetical protein
MNEPIARSIVYAGVAAGGAVWLLVLARWRALRFLSAPMPVHVTARNASLEDVERGVLELALARQWQCVSHEGGTIVLRLPLGAGLRVKLQRAFSRTEAVVESDLAPLDRRFARWVGAFLFVIPAVVAGLALLLLHLAVPSTLPAIRGQSLQILQIAHVLWPPFLITFLHARIRSAILAAASDAALRIETLGPVAHRT